MASRRHIRESAVQLLYCAHLNGGTAPPGLRGMFWRMVTETARRELMAATLRCIRHLCHGRPERLAEWHARLPAARAAIATSPGSDPLADALAALVTAEEQVSSASDPLEHLSLEGADDDIARHIDAAIERLFDAEAVVRAARQRFLSTLVDFPELLPALEPLAGATRRLDRISDRLTEVRDPARLPERAEFEHVRRAREQLDGLREGAEHFVDAVLDHLGPLDAALTAIIENFAPERLDLVDRSILRLAAWEILCDPSVPNVVAINEAVEIAKRFGTADSARFVNGVLDRLARNQ